MADLEAGVAKATSEGPLLRPRVNGFEGLCDHHLRLIAKESFTHMI